MEFVVGLVFEVLPEQEGGGLVAGQVQGQALYEALQVLLALGRDEGGPGAPPRGRSPPAPGRRRPFSTSPRDARQDALQAPVQLDSRPRWTKRMAAVDLGGVEEGELLLVAQHLDRWLVQDGEVQRLTSGWLAKT